MNEHLEHGYVYVQHYLKELETTNEPSTSQPGGVTEESTSEVQPEPETSQIIILDKETEPNTEVVGS